jgi:hypothetical protein
MIREPAGIFPWPPNFFRAYRSLASPNRWSIIGVSGGSSCRLGRASRPMAWLTRQLFAAGRAVDDDAGRGLAKVPVRVRTLHQDHGRCPDLDPQEVRPGRLKLLAFGERDAVNHQVQQIPLNRPRLLP